METTIYMNVFIFILFSIINTVLSLKIPAVFLGFKKWLFKERAWEEGGIVYQRVFKVKNWKNKSPELSDIIKTIFTRKRIEIYDKDYLHKYLIESCRAELTHWGIIFSSFLFVLWSSVPRTSVMIIIALVLNLPYVIIQRYNRPRIINLLAYSGRKRASQFGKSSLSAQHRNPVSILFISADKTGYGHKSITEALQQQMTELNPDAHISIIDGFSLGKWMLRVSSRLYNPLAVNMPALWGILYRTGNHSTRLINAFLSRDIKNKLVKCLKEVQPDVIVPVHGAFVGSILNILEQEKLDIPVIPFIADLDNVAGLWADKRATYTLCPSVESKQTMLSLGIAEDKLRLVDFPVRKEFRDTASPAPKEGINWAEGASILLINGSQGSWQTMKMVRSLLKYSNCRISIMAGNNSSLKKYLENKLSLYIGDRVQIYGFTKDIKKHMLAADILVVRASPNVLMEAVNLCKPIIVVGALKGQEEKNPEFVVRHNLGVYCKDIKMLPHMVLELLSQNGKKLKKIQENQTGFRNPHAAREIAEFIIDSGCQAAGFYTLSSESDEDKLHAVEKTIPINRKQHMT